jgi:hypothetical protein
LLIITYHPDLFLLTTPLYHGHLASINSTPAESDSEHKGWTWAVGQGMYYSILPTSIPSLHKHKTGQVQQQTQGDDTHTCAYSILQCNDILVNPP